MPEQTQDIIADQRPSPIEEPPLKNRKSCLRRSCSFTFGCLFLILLALAIISWLFSKPPVARLAGLPSEFPTDIPLYKFEERSTVSYIAGDKKDTRLQQVARLPRLLIESGLNRKFNWQDFKDLFSPVAKSPTSETVIISWENLDDEQKDIYLFFKNNLQKQDYQINPTDANKSPLNFQKDNIVGSVLIERPADAPKQVNVILKVDYFKK